MNNGRRFYHLMPSPYCPKIPLNPFDNIFHIEVSRDLTYDLTLPIDIIESGISCAV